MARPADGALLGGWGLVSYVGVDETGRTVEGPLGPHPRGLLIYAADGSMSVSMMAGDPAGTGFMGYAGTWHLDGRQIVHRVSVASHTYLLGTDQTRDLGWDGADLVLSGAAPPAAAGPRQRVLTWRRLEGKRP